MKILEGLYYTEDHEWIKVEGDKACIGITDYAQNALGSIVFIELPDVDTVLSKGDGFGVVESVKAASDVYSPLSGKVLKINEEIVDDPSLLNQDPYEYWMICVDLEDKSELEGLMDAKAYENFTDKE